MPETGVERSLPKWALPAVYAAFAALNLWLSRKSLTPLIHSDEAGYLGNARYMVDRNGLSGSPIEYYPGYSLLLIPAALLTDGGTSFFRAAVVTNALVMSTLPVLLYFLLARLAPSATALQRLGAAAITSAYPSFLLFGWLAVAENVYVPLFALTCLLAARAYEGGDRAPARWALFGAAAGSLMVVHGRSVAILLATAAAVAWWAFGSFKERLASAASCAAALAVSVAAGLALRAWIPSPDPLGDPSETSVRGILRRTLAGELVDNLVGGFAGQGFYLAVGTAGLFLLGLFVVARSSWASRGRGDVAFFVFLSTVGVWAVSALFMNGGNRLDHLIYGRYNEGVLAPVLATGVAILLAARWPVRTRVLAFAGGAGGLLVLAIVLKLLGTPQSKVLVPTNVYAIYPFLEKGTLDLLPITGVGLLALAVVWLVPRFGPVLLAVGFLGLSVYVGADFLEPGSRSRDDQRSLVASINALDRMTPLPCIGWAVGGHSDWHFHNYEFFVPDLRFEILPRGSFEPTCSDALIAARRDLDAVVPGLRLVDLESHYPEALWLLPGPRQQEAVRAGYILPPSTDDYRVPAAAARASLKLLEPAGGSLTIPSGSDPPRVKVQVRHDGAGTGWPSLYGLVREKGPVRLAVSILDRPGGKELASGRGELPRSLYPGQTAIVEADVPLGSISQGTFTLRLQMVQEGIGFFEGGPQSVIEVPLKVG